MSKVTIEYKVCTKCGESKPATTEFFHKRCNSISARCKVCVCTDKRSAAEKQPAHYRWKAMMGRCYNVEHERYNTYGGIGWLYAMSGMIMVRFKTGLTNTS